jgi:hypothetical protein
MPKKRKNKIILTTRLKYGKINLDNSCLIDLDIIPKEQWNIKEFIREGYLVLAYSMARGLEIKMKENEKQKLTQTKA